jgi:hypothetical protein
MAAGLSVVVMMISAFLTLGGNQAQADQSHIQNVMVSGDTVIGEISAANPAPEFLIAANPGDILRIDVVGIDSDLDPMIQILDSSNQVIAQGAGTGEPNHVVAELYILRPDRFAIQVQSSSRQNGEFAITVNTDEDALLDVPQLAVGQTITGQVNADQPMQFFTLDYSSTEPLMLVISSPTYLPPVMIENTTTRQLVGQVMPPVHAGMLCMAPGMHSHRVDIMYSGAVPEQAFELTLEPASSDLSQWCAAQGAATSSADAATAPSAYSPNLFTARNTAAAGTNSLTNALTDGGSTGGTVPPGVIGGSTGGGTTGGGTGDCGGGDISLCVDANVGGGSTGGGADDCGGGDISLCVDANVGGGNGGSTGGGAGDCGGGDISLCVDANVGGGNGVNVDANANVGGGNGVNVDANANVGGGGPGISVDANVGGGLLGGD